MVDRTELPELFTVLLHLMIESLNSSSLIVNLSHPGRVVLDDLVAWSNLVVHVFLYVLCLFILHMLICLSSYLPVI